MLAPSELDGPADDVVGAETVHRDRPALVRRTGQDAYADDAGAATSSEAPGSSSPQGDARRELADLSAEAPRRVEPGARSLHRQPLVGAPVDREIAIRGEISAAARRGLVGVEVPGAETRSPPRHRQERDVDRPDPAPIPSNQPVSPAK